MIDWSKVSTPGAPPSGNPQTTTAAIPPATSDLTQAAPDTQQGPGLGASLGNSTQGQQSGYQTGNGWRPASQAEVDALDPGQRIGRGIDYLGYLLFGNKSDQQGGDQFGHQAPLAGTGPLRDVIGLGGEAIHAVGTTTVVRPIEIGANVLSGIPLGWVPGGADDTFKEIGASLDPKSDLYHMWEQTKALAEADVLGGGNIKANFNDEVLKMMDDAGKDSVLGTTPTLYLGRRTVGSFGGAVSHAIEGFLGVMSNESQLLLGQAGLFDPYYSGHKAGEGGSTQMSYLLDAAANPDKYVMYAGSSTSFNLTTMNDFERYAVTKVQSGEWSQEQAQGWVDKNINTKLSRVEEAAARADVGMELSDVEQKAVQAYQTGAWSKQHAEEWIVSHGQGVTRNPVGQIAGTVVTDPLTYITLGLGGVSALGTSGLKVAEAADVTIQSMKGLSLTERIAASSGNALRIAKEIPNAESTYKQIAMGIAAVQKSPAGPVARIGRGLIDPFGVWKPSMVDKTAIAIKNQVAVGALQRAHGPQAFSELEAIGRETGTTTEIRTAAHNYAVDQADLMTSIEAQGQMLHKGMGIEMMDPNSEINNVDNVVDPMVENYATKDAQTRLTDHIVEHSKVTFTPAEEANLGHRLGTTLGGGIDWTARVAKMSHDLKSLLHAITYKLTETDWYNALNAVDRNAYDGELPLHLGAIMDHNTMDETMAKKAVADVEAILSDTKRPDRVEAATKLWNDLSNAHDRMGNLGYAPGGEKQLQQLIREMKSEIEQGGFPKIWTEQELSHPALQPLRDVLDRHSIPMTPEEVAAAKEAAVKTATTSFKRKAALEARRTELKDALRALETKSGKVRAGKQVEHDSAQKELEDFLGKHPEAKARLDVQAEKAAVEAAQLEDEAYLRGFEAAKRSKTGNVAAAKERFVKNNPNNADPNSLFEAGWADAQAGKNFGDALAAGGHGVDNLPAPGSLAPTLEETVAAAEASVTGIRRLWKVGSRPEETVAWGLKHDVNTGLPMRMREPTISHNFMAYPGKAPFSDTVRNALGQIIGTVPADKVAKPIDSMEVFINTMQDVITGRRLVMNMQQRFERSMFDAGVPKPLIRTIFGKAKDVAGLEKTTLRGLSAAEDGGLWKAIADDIPRDLRLANGQALDIHTVMDHLLQASEGDLRIMGLTSKFSQRMRNAMRAANLDPVNYSGQMSVTAYNKMRYALNPTFIIQRMTDSIYYSILYGVTPVGMGALSESNMALRAITENLARTGTARDFAFDLPEFATRANWTAGVKSALQQSGISENTLSKIANAPDALIQHNMVNLLHARLGSIVRGTLDNLATAIEKDATLIAGATPEQANILRRSFADWRAVYSKNAGRVLSDDEVGFQYIKDMLSGWRRVGPINPDTGLIDMKGLLHEGTMMMPSDIGAMGSIMPDSLAGELGYVGENASAAMRKDVMGSLQKVGGTYQHVLGEHDIAWLKEQLVNKLGAHPDYVKRALAYFGDTWDNYWYRLSLPVDKGGLDISEHYAKEAQQIIAREARSRGMDPWEYLSGVMLINSGTDSLDTAMGRFINFLKKGEVNAEPSDWGAFFRSHLDPSAQTTLMDAYGKAQAAAAEAARAPKVGDKFVRTEADGRQFQWHVYSYDPKTGGVGITTNPKGPGRLGHMTREEWDALKTPGATAAATPADVPIQPPLGFVSNPHIVASGHAFPPDIPRDGLFHVTTGKDGVMSQGFRGSNAGEDVADQLQGIGSTGDTLNKGRVSFVTSSVRAQAYHDRLLLAVKAARGEITNAEVADYFIPLYQKAYGEEFAQRMKSALNDATLLEGTTHTPQELVYMVKRLDDGLIGGSGGVSPGGMKTGLSSAEGAVHLTSKAEQLAKIDPEQIAIINLATREKAVANKGIDVGELTLPPEDLHPMSVVGEKPGGTQPKYVVDPTDQANYDASMKAWQAEQDAYGNQMVEHNQAMEQHTYAQLAYENDKINYTRDLKQYDRLAKQHEVLQKEYDSVVAENAQRDAQHAAEVKQYKADLKAYEAEQKAYDDAVQASQDAMDSADVPPRVQQVIDRFSEKKDPTRLRTQFEKMADEGYDVGQADSLLDDYTNIERDGMSMEEYAAEKQDAWDAIMQELEAVPPIEGELPMEPIPPTPPVHPGELPLPPKPIAPVKPIEPVAPVAPKPPVAPTTERPQPPKMMELKQEPAPEAQVPPVDEQQFWDKGIIDMLEQRSKTGPHPNPDVEGAIQKVAELTQRVLKDSKGAKNTRNTIRELGKAIPLTNPVPYNRSHVLIQHLVQTKIEDAQRDIFRLAEMQTQRTVLERSLNHPLFGLYPASYMWGKVLPESIKFLAKNPYAATYIINDVQRAIAVQREFDPEFEDKMNAVDRSAAAFWVDYMTPGLPWSDHSARMSPMFKDILKGDLVNILPDELATMNPKRWYDQTLRTMQEIPGAVDTITGGDQQTQQRLQGALGSSFGGGPTAAPGTGTKEQISGAVQAAALAPILADDLSRLQDILLGGQPAGE